MSVKEQIKIALIKKNITLTDLVNKLNAKYNRQDSVQNLSAKLTRNTLKYREAEEIAEILGISIIWQDNKKEE